MKFSLVKSSAQLIQVLVLFFAVTQSAHAIFISMDRTSLGANYGVVGFQGNALEIELNQKVFNPMGVEFEIASEDLNAIFVDDFGFEGNGLTIIGGGGFILRFDRPASFVRMIFGDFKDDGLRNLYAYDTSVDYVRSATDFSQHPDGTVISNPTTANAIDSASGVIPLGNVGFELDLVVSGGNINSVWANTINVFDTLVAIEFELEPLASPVPAPASIWLFLAGALGLAGLRRKPVYGS